MIRFLQSLKKHQKIALILLVILLVTNPSHKDCQEFGQNSPTNKVSYVNRDFNFFVFSIYKIGYKVKNKPYHYRLENRYVGILGNFFKI